MELWKDIPNYEGIYQASTEGRIRTCEGKTTVNANDVLRVWQQRVLKPKVGKRCKGHSTEKSDYRVTLWKNGEHKDFLVSRLVALTWVEGYKDGMTVNHIDGNSLNNAVSNLEWLSVGDNIRDGYRTGLYEKKCKKTSLTDGNGNVKFFQSQLCADRFLGRSEGYISMLLVNGYKQATSVSGERYIINAA